MNCKQPFGMIFPLLTDLVFRRYRTLSTVLLRSADGDYRRGHKAGDADGDGGYELALLGTRLDAAGLHRVERAGDLQAREVAGEEAQVAAA